MARFVFILLLLAVLSAAPRSQAVDNLPRTWTNSLGIKTEATFVRVEGAQVTLLLNNGNMVTMSLDKLSLEDQEYIHGMQTSEADPQAPANSPQPADASQPSTSVTLSKKSILLRPALIHAPDPRVQPKAEIYVPFEELGKSRTDEPMGMRIRIPGNYSPDRPVPLLVWLAGGDGNTRFNAAMSLVNPEDFVLVGINYPADPVPNPTIAARTGHIEQVWDPQEKILAKLQDMIPNIDPRLRVVVGFSNGAHTIGGCLAHQIEGITWFNVFVLIEGGISDKYDYPPLPGRYYYVAWGDQKEGRGNDFGQMLAGYARKAQMKVEAHPMIGVGHDFPDSEQEKVREWLRTVVIPEQLSKP